MIQIRSSVGTTFLFVIFITVSISLFPQSDTTYIRVRSVDLLEKKIAVKMDSASKKTEMAEDRKTFCAQKWKAYDSLKIALRARLDSAKKAITILNEEEKGPYYHYLVIKETRQTYFDWEGCRNATMSHDYIDLSIEFRKHEKFRILPEGNSTGRVFYAED